MQNSIPKINLRNYCISSVLLLEYITIHGRLNVTKKGFKLSDTGLSDRRLRTSWSVDLHEFG